jgi:hypothetical protein
MPVQADRAIGIGTLDMFDRTLFEPSKLPAKRRTELGKEFAASW